ncbi:hypothetical protein EK904_011376 [Melospiza melodia maxima]|nr:hypothetical protein EK904_011376 [Melospiza melodia maxima]
MLSSALLSPALITQLVNDRILKCLFLFDMFIRIKIESFAGVPDFVCKDKRCHYLLGAALELGEHSLCSSPLPQ